LRTTKALALRVVAVVAAVVMATAATATAAHAGDSPWGGCPSGAVCMWSGPPGDPGHIVAVWWDGVYQLNNVYGGHQIMNNQTDGWVVELCRGWYGNNCVFTLAQDWWTGYDFGPINSVYLHP
jgi:hypothetical protein